MYIDALVVTSDARMRSRITQLLHFQQDDTVTFSLRFASALADVAAPAQRRPDLLLVDEAFAGISGTGSARAAAAALRVPLFLLSAAAPAAPARRRTLSGTAGVLDAHGSHDTACRQLGRAVSAARRKRVRGHGAIGSDSALASMADAVIITDLAGTVCYSNPAADTLMASTSDDMLGLSIDRLMPLHDARTIDAVAHPVLKVLEDQRSARLQLGVVLVRPDGSEIMIEDSTSPIVGNDGTVEGAVMVFHDVTASHELQTQVDYLAHHDFLTGLPNRFAAQRHLKAILAQAHDHPRPLAVMYLDLDNFKFINDTLGHAAGDELLVSVAARLRTCMRTVDLVGRQGGDEFLVLMAPGTGAEQAIDTARRLLRALAKPHRIGGEDILVGCSVGIALSPRHGVTEASLLQHADTALHAAKASGRNTWRLFDDAMLTSAVRRRMLENALRQALDGGRLDLFYQPKVALDSGAVNGCEALLRWRHPDWGWVAPTDFIACAEQAGLILALGRWALAEALRQARRWEDDGSYLGPIAVNVSALELRQPGFVDQVAECCARHGVAPERVQIELTESALMRDAAGVLEVLNGLRSLGVSLAIDDFGTGYSSLSYLADLPVNVLKIDRAFVHGVVDAGTRRQSLLRAVLSVAANMDLPAIAEGIETSAEADFVRTAGCETGQGYHYSPALAAPGFIHFLQARAAQGPMH